MFIFSWCALNDEIKIISNENKKREDIAQAPSKEYQACSSFGIMDTCGFPKDDCFYYEARMKDTPLIHTMPHWTWEKEREIRAIGYRNGKKVAEGVQPWVPLFRFDIHYEK